MSLFSFVRSSLDIITVVEQYVSLKKYGAYYKGRCPFHQEKTASFTVSPHKEIFYCFGCHAKGDVISFTAQLERCSQKEAALILAERHKITLPSEYISHDGDKKNYDEKARFHGLLSIVTDWCMTQMSRHDPSRKYLIDRGLSPETITLGHVGYFPSGQKALNDLAATCSKQGYLSQELYSVGIIARSPKGPYSPFEDRIMFPIADFAGRIVGFGGRTWRPQDQRPKYYNSRESTFFTKGNYLFGLDLARTHATNSIILVEGYLDCLALWQAGYRNTVATLGTACTAEHLALVARYVPMITIMYDGDAAGQAAMLRLTELCWNVNLDVTVVTLPSGEDPASLVAQQKTLGPFFAQALDIFSFFVINTGAQLATEPLARKIPAIRTLVSTIMRVNDPLTQDILLHRAAQACDVSFDVLMQERAARAHAKNSPRVAPVQNSNTIDNYSDSALLCAGALTGTISLEKLQKIIFDEPYQEIITQYIQFTRSNPKESVTQFLELLSPPLNTHARDLIEGGQYHIAPEDLAQIYQRYYRKHWYTTINDIKIKIAQAQKNNDSATEERLLRLLQTQGDPQL